ncbi:hypothetical protein J437_LFUL008293 [Ladona fulva]|uniref:Uncharacterized protein n=1 Tax=Ladona fulva TaxID=123851 RepID=A0A8K0K6H9_LADFU|nr:hypothetical protein J437_LFUL008293 [Ladona fulva]
MHKRVKDITGMSKRRRTSLLIDTDGRPIIDIKHKLRRWTAYIKDLFNDEERGNSKNIYTEEGPEILRSEVEQALKNSKNGKASGPDEIPVELLQLMDDENITVLLNLFNAIYFTGQIPAVRVTRCVSKI